MHRSPPAFASVAIGGVASLSGDADASTGGAGSASRATTGSALSGLAAGSADERGPAGADSAIGGATAGALGRSAAPEPHAMSTAVAATLQVGPRKRMDRSRIRILRGGAATVSGRPTARQVLERDGALRPEGAGVP